MRRAPRSAASDEAYGVSFVDVGIPQSLTDELFHPYGGVVIGEMQLPPERDGYRTFSVPIKSGKYKATDIVL